MEAKRSSVGDFIKEIKEREQKYSSLKNFIDGLSQEQIGLEEKAHLLKVIKFSRDIVSLSRIDIVEDYQINSIGFYHYYKKLGEHEVNHYKKKGEHDIKFYLYNSDGHRLDHCIGDREYTDISKDFSMAFKRLETINPGYINESFEYEYYESIPLTKEAENKIFTLLLNKELKSFLEYSKMQAMLEKKEVVSKKYKL